MMKLVDYFVVVGYDDIQEPGEPESSSSNYNNSSSLDNEPEVYGHSNNRTAAANAQLGKAKIIQRFPLHTTGEQEEFDTNVHCFCQPHKGWRLYAKQEPPTFFVSVLTDIKGQRRYCACLTFLEPYAPSRTLQQQQQQHRRYSSTNDEDDDELDNSDLEIEEVGAAFMDRNKEHSSLVF